MDMDQPEGRNETNLKSYFSASVVFKAWIASGVHPQDIETEASAFLAWFPTIDTQGMEMRSSTRTRIISYENAEFAPRPRSPIFSIRTSRLEAYNPKMNAPTIMAAIKQSLFTDNIFQPPFVLG